MSVALALRNAVVIGDLKGFKRLWQQNSHLIERDFNNKKHVLHEPEPACLHLACRYGRLQIVQFLIEKGLSIESLSSDDEVDPSQNIICRYTPLHCSSKHGNVEIVSFLIKQGANIESQVNDSSTGVTPLELACIYDQVEAARILLEAGATADSSIFVDTCERVLLDFTALLLMYGLDGDEIIKESDDSVIYLACRSGNDDLVEFLLIQGALIEGGGSPGRTPLLEVCERSAPEVARVLLDQGANIGARNLYGQTPLHVATIAGCTETVELLLIRGADTNVTDLQGNTPVHYAVESSNWEMARIFFKQDFAGWKTG